MARSAAFQLDAPDADARLQPVHDSLLYLRSFVNDSAAAFGRFDAARILLAAGGYALHSAIKTLACLGVRRLAVLPTGGDWQPHELQAAFAELARWPDARLDIVAAPEAGYTYVVQVADDASAPFERLLAALPAARHLVAFAAQGQLCALHGSDLALLPARRGDTRLAPPDGLCAGATAAMICFDDLCGVRPLAPRRYLHFGLDADVPLNSAGLYPLAPFDAANAGATGAIVVAERIEELACTPLAPLRPPVERTPESGCLKLYTLEACLPGRADPVVLAGAGMTRARCVSSALLQLAAGQRHWFSHTDADERAAVGHYLAQLDVAAAAVAPLRAAAPAAGPAPELSAREHYLGFCIAATYGEPVQWSEAALDGAPWPRCTVLRGGAVAIYLPHDGVPAAAQREAGLLALYGALWQGHVNGRDIVLPDEPLQPGEPA
ncbi:hypothetical protein [Pseudoduganella chitinolytica]|uniref:DUF115 domain-containing protein n=1 Tax=Pseudoduganella chitinolytica TaxID=34070 RepID=A0ABY8B6P1_9BURK|nr:hypothetical protein [Pseudoduganella chitinolytica]WEF31605.1 hypothetical protein PX653_19380 [Pseudoduganella chitinolytica]